MSKDEAAGFSFEFFPPKTPDAETQLYDTAEKLAGLNPRFMTVTYGAGGSTREWSIGAATKLQDLTHIPTAAHLTYITHTKDELMALADHLWEKNIRHLVALRGDLPQGKGLSYADFTGPDHFQYTSDFVAALRARHPFEISVGAYPEKHPDAQTLDADITALRLKCDAGARRAITQFFFDNAGFYRFLERTKAAGITTPIVPGLLPIVDFEKMVNFAARCGANVPEGLQEKFAPLTTPEDRHALAQDLLIDQMRDLYENGVRHFHFYTLNRSEMPAFACRALHLIA